MHAQPVVSSWITPAARAGLAAKGVVYCLIGILAFMAAFHIAGQSSSTADKEGALQFIRQSGGKVLLAILAVGLFCYSAWRVAEAFRKGHQGQPVKSWGNKLRYLSSGVVYLSLAVLAGRMVLFNDNSSGGGNSPRQVVQELLTKPFGQWLVGLLAVLIAGIGVYQVWYGLSEKYRRHVSQLNLSSGATTMLLRSGKIGYAARGIVWLLIAWLIVQAAVEANSAKAGDTAGAFRFLQEAAYGSYLLGALGLGLVCYGVFNFVRARYESFS